MCLIEISVFERVKKKKKQPTFLQLIVLNEK